MMSQPGLASCAQIKQAVVRKKTTSKVALVRRTIFFRCTMTNSSSMVEYSIIKPTPTGINKIPRVYAISGARWQSAGVFEILNTYYGIILCQKNSLFMSEKQSIFTESVKNHFAKNRRLAKGESP